jgi:hypothetical protein
MRLALVLLVAVPALGFELFVNDYGKQCFYEEMDKGVSLSGTFVVLEGGDGAVDFTVGDPRSLQTVPCSFDFCVFPLPCFDTTTCWVPGSETPWTHSLQVFNANNGGEEANLGVVAAGVVPAAAAAAAAVTWWM